MIISQSLVTQNYNDDLLQNYFNSSYLCSTYPQSFAIDGEPAFETRLEGLNFDSTVAVLGRYSQYENVAISVKRVFQRGEVVVQMVGPGGKKN